MASKVVLWAVCMGVGEAWEATRELPDWLVGVRLEVTFASSRMS